jgi:hypothetical protein
MTKLRRKYCVTTEAVQKHGLARSLLAAFIFAMFSTVALADTFVPANTHVTQIASAQLFAQNAVIFQLDKGTSDCAAGRYVYFYSNNIDNLKAMYATVLAAYTAGSPLIVHFQTAGNCVSDSIGVGS